jgi:hypothetical protein
MGSADIEVRTMVTPSTVVGSYSGALVRWSGGTCSTAVDFPVDDADDYKFKVAWSPAASAWTPDDLYFALASRAQLDATGWRMPEAVPPAVN